MNDTESIRFSLREALAVTAAAAAVCAVVAYTNSVVIAIHLTTVFLGFVIWRYAQGHLGGLIPTLLGGDLLLGFSLGWVVNGSEDFMGFRGLIFGVASVLFLTGLGVFLGIASYRRRYWRHQAAIAITLGAIFVIGWIVVPTLGKAATLRRQKADIAANTAATAQAIALVATVCQQVGSAPDLEALKKQLGGPLPSVRWDGYSHEIMYVKTGANTYQLQYIDPTMFMGDICIYDSSTPARGWFRVKF